MSLIMNRNLAKAALNPILQQWYGREQVRFSLDLNFQEAIRLFQDRNECYLYFHHYFYNLCSKSVKEHRRYFKDKKRGFGEDAFHAMWYVLFREYKPRNCLEIGVYRGQTISLWALLGQELRIECDVWGISPFSSAGDSYTKYDNEVDYLKDVIINFDYFHLPAPKLIRAYSNDSTAIACIRQTVWDMVYIDGSHDYDIVRSDYQICRDHLKEGGLLILDDSSLGTGYRPLSFSFAGHPGPSRVASEIAHKEMAFLGSVGHANVFLNRKRLVKP